MKRKVIKQGASTLTVSLPQAWAQQLNLQAGDELEVQEQGALLKVYASKVAAKREVTCKQEDALEPMVIGLYLHGYEELSLRFPEGFLGAVQELASDLMGMALTDSAPTSCTLREIGAPSADEFQALFAEVINGTAKVAQGAGSVALVRKYARYCMRLVSRGLVQEGVQHRYAILASFMQLASVLASMDEQSRKKAAPLVQGLCISLLENKPVTVVAEARGMRVPGSAPELSCLLEVLILYGPDYAMEAMGNG
ncbi:hypothetical protein COY28_01845 [Candidatus Woesearchaeota archaeon CG_4_10_14_0_2_um_filter_57_5]|nr:MAG: hypothetical protein AUJ68_02575 [Candidatus Woesearchaeota archaeon CG1_02_57_44]PIN70734.1 MAG: hypothetical protein COV94_01335 [Candidatus Woesearchaeota archaeon CG11_big_fil_rev_8_21_14_0_20_57_5]PIZ55549.1 MAG: hypothetical protein COY28_01845 [Candidatus Woesearchaeota archaeon CG_4_10_14_0_2_um_filter_57_5]